MYGDGVLLLSFRSYAVMRSNLKLMIVVNGGRLKLKLQVQ